MAGGPFYGKYRGVVVDDADPELLGRVRAKVPDVLGDVEPWAAPCVPWGADRRAIPDVGTHVWIEFEGGDPDRPIWSGCWWTEPGPLTSAETVVVAAGGHTIIVDESADADGLIIRSATGALISLTRAGIVIDNGAGARITLVGPQVSINDGALDVT